MGTVGLSFGSATSGQGFDVSTTVSSIIATQSGIETPWKTQLTTLQSQDTAFSTLGTDLSNLSTSLAALTDFDGVTSEMEGSSSNTNVIALSSATSQAQAGTHEITVSQLAQTSSVFTNEIDANDTLSGSLSIQVGSGTEQTVTVGDSSNTLSTLAAAINQADIGVTASVVSDTNGSRLSLVSDTSGSTGQLTVTSSLSDATTNSSLTTQTGENGQDALLTVDGIDVDSASNTISTAIPGVTFEVLSTSSDPVQVAIENDTTDIGTAVDDFVTAYNQLVTDMNTQEGNDSSGNPEPLYGNSTLALMQTTLSESLNTGAASGSISTLSQLGITVNEDGSLTYTDSDLQDSLNSDFSGVVGFLQNSDSWGSSFTDALNSLSPTLPDGAVYLAEQQNQTEESGLNTDISNEQSLLATETTNLTTELNTANETLQAIPEQLDEVNELYSAITGYNETTS